MKSPTAIDTCLGNCFFWLNESAFQRGVWMEVLS